MPGSIAGSGSPAAPDPIPGPGATDDAPDDGLPAALSEPVPMLDRRADPGSGLRPLDIRTLLARRAAELAAADPLPSGSTVQGIAEGFPLEDLGRIDGRGPHGQTFLLDGGALEGLKLQVRRVIDGDEPGFEVTAKLTPVWRDALLEALELRGAEATGLSFRAATTDADGLTRLDEHTTTIGADPMIYASPNVAEDGDTWVLALDGPEGGAIEVADDRSGLAARGLVRIRLRGVDAACTQQLQALVSELGLEPMLAPPSDTSKRRLALMRALWQADHATARELARGDLDRLDPAAIEKRLLAKGYDQARIDGLRWDEVSPGHFSVLDPVAGAELRDAGARYLTHHTWTPEGAADMLASGLKCTLRRFSEGTLVPGLSSVTDFGTGGAVGVFTRLVTEDALLDGSEGSYGRVRFDLDPQLLDRTDWYGHDTDFFGRAWWLTSEDNFGAGLLDRIDGGEGGRYHSGNELIFRSGIPVEAIRRVVVPDEPARESLLQVLAARGWQPPEGRSLDEMIVVSARLEPLEQPAFDLADPDAFTERTLARAQAGDPRELRRFLALGPEAPAVRAGLERRLLTSDHPASTDLLLRSLRSRGRFAMPATAVADRLSALLESPRAKDNELGERMLSELPRALLQTGDESVAARLAAHAEAEAAADPPVNVDRPLGLNWVGWGDVLDDLLARREAGGPDAPSAATIDLAARLGLPVIARMNRRPLREIFEAHPQLASVRSPEDFARALDQLPEGGDPTAVLLYLASLSSSVDVAAAERVLLACDRPAAIEVLRLHIGMRRVLSLDATALADAIDALPLDAPMRDELLSKHVELVLRPGAPRLLELVSGHAEQRGQGPEITPPQWKRLISTLAPKGDAQPDPALSWALNRALDAFFSQAQGFGDHALSPTNVGTPGLFGAVNPRALAEASAPGVERSASDRMRVMWCLGHPDTADDDKAQVLEKLLKQGGEQARRIVGWHCYHNGPLKVAPKGLIDIALDHHRRGPDGEAALAWLLGRLPAPAVRAMTPELVEVVRARTAADPKSLPIPGTALRDALAGLLERADAHSGDLVRWILEASTRERLLAGDSPFVKLLEQTGYDRSDLGWTDEQSVEVVQEFFTTYNPDTFVRFPDFLPWLLTATDGAIDAALTGQLLAALPARFPDQPETSRLALDALSFLGPAWQQRLEAARAHMA